jgi:NADH dehydrogenase
MSRLRLASPAAKHGKAIRGRPAAAVADIAGLHLGGLIAWLMWLFVHIFFLIGFRNRFIVIVEWAWTYVRNDRGARLITGDVEPLLERGEKKENRDRMLSK